MSLFYFCCIDSWRRIRESFISYSRLWGIRKDYREFSWLIDSMCIWLAYVDLFSCWRGFCGFIGFFVRESGNWSFARLYLWGPRKFLVKGRRSKYFLCLLFSFCLLLARNCGLIYLFRVWRLFVLLMIQLNSRLFLVGSVSSFLCRLSSEDFSVYYHLLYKTAIRHCFSLLAMSIPVSFAHHYSFCSPILVKFCIELVRLDPIIIY